MRYNRARIVELIKRLRSSYPESRASARRRQPFRILITTILSAQCTDKRAEETASYIFKKYKDAEALSRARLATVEKELYSTGLYRHKARSIIATSKKLLRDYGGRVPDRMKELIRLPGVGRKTANIVLSSAFRKAEGIAVDTHVARISRRLGLSNAKSPENIEKELLRIIPRKDWLDFNYILVAHGKKICRARNPLHDICPVRELCPYVR